MNAKWVNEMPLALADYYLAQYDQAVYTKIMWGDRYGLKGPSDELVATTARYLEYLRRKGVSTDWL